jgi:hypothetical protein
MNDAMALHMMVSSGYLLYSYYTLSLSALKLCIDSGHCKLWNWCFHVNLLVLATVPFDRYISVEYRVRCEIY